jgi:hypothetical protein
LSRVSKISRYANSPASSIAGFWQPGFLSIFEFASGAGVIDPIPDNNVGEALTEATVGRFRYPNFPHLSKAKPALSKLHWHPFVGCMAKAFRRSGETLLAGDNQHGGPLTP